MEAPAPAGVPRDKRPETGLQDRAPLQQSSPQSSGRVEVVVAVEKTAGKAWREREGEKEKEGPKDNKTERSKKWERG